MFCCKSKNAGAKVLKALHNLLTNWCFFTGKDVYKNSVFIESDQKGLSYFYAFKIDPDFLKYLD
jgi:hypothetical protein